MHTHLNTCMTLVFLFVVRTSYIVLGGFQGSGTVFFIFSMFRQQIFKDGASDLEWSLKKK